MIESVAFLTEANFFGKIPRESNNIRTDSAWMIALDAFHYPMHFFLCDIEENIHFDHCFVILPKDEKKLSVFLERCTVDYLKKYFENVYMIQEGPSDYFHDYSVSTQILFLNFIRDCDRMFCHSFNDWSYYFGITNSSKIYLIPSLMIENNFIKSIKNWKEKENKIIIGGNMCKWYGGINSYLSAIDLGLPIYSPSMGRKKDDESLLDITHLPYMSWTNWMDTLKIFKYAIHMMPTIAAGTFNLNCAYLGVPCIGNQYVETQSKLFPKLSISPFDIYQAKIKLKELHDNQCFYHECVEMANRNYAVSNFKEENWLKYMENTLIE